MSTTKVTKAQLQEQVETLQRQVSSLQDELGDRCAQLSEVETRAADLNDELTDVYKQATEGMVNRIQLMNTAFKTETLANRLAWAIETAQSLRLYMGGNPEVYERTLAMIVDESEDFIGEFSEGHFDYETIVNDTESAEDTVAVATASVASALEGLFAETIQEVPDDQPDGFDPETGAPYFVEPISNSVH